MGDTSKVLLVLNLKNKVIVVLTARLRLKGIENIALDRVVRLR